MGAKWRTKTHKPGTFFKAKGVAISTVSPLFTCLGFTLDMVCIGTMHCVDLGGGHPRGVQVCGAN